MVTKVMLTGAAGYIGSHNLIRMLEQTDWEVVCVDNYANSSAATYDRVRSICNKPFHVVDLDLKDTARTRALFNEHRDLAGIIHFAAHKSVPESVEKPIEYYENNLESLLNVIRCQQEFGVRHLIFSSSCSVYGNTQVLPVTEDTPFGTWESPYAHTKQLGERTVEACFSGRSDYSAISLRYFNPVGAHASGKNGELPLGVPNNLVPFIAQAAIGKREELVVFGDDYDTRDGSCIRDYIHVNDIADAHVQALRVLFDGSLGSSYDVINLGTGNGVSVFEAIRAFESANGVKVPHRVGPRRAGDVVEVYANNDKARRVLGWTPQISLEDAMVSAWRWEQTMAKGQ